MHVIFAFLSGRYSTSSILKQYCTPLTSTPDTATFTSTQQYIYIEMNLNSGSAYYGFALSYTWIENRKINIPFCIWLMNVIQIATLIKNAFLTDKLFKEDNWYLELLGISAILFCVKYLIDKDCLKNIKPQYETPKLAIIYRRSFVLLIPVLLQSKNMPC